MSWTIILKLFLKKKEKRKEQLAFVTEKAEYKAVAVIVKSYAAENQIKLQTATSHPGREKKASVTKQMLQITITC